MRYVLLSCLAAAALAAGCAQSGVADPDWPGPSAPSASPAPGGPAAGGSNGPSGAAPSGGAGAPAPLAKNDLYYRTFGRRSDPAVIFLHGGPGATSWGFEMSAAQPLADRGYFVVTYDQRGSGRSPKGTTADYTYERAAADLASLIADVGLTKPILLAHSFGGSVALHFLELRPGVARGAVLLGSPMNFPDTYLTLLQKCADYYRVSAPGKAVQLDQLKTQMFPNGLVPPFSYPGDDIAQVMQNTMATGLEFTMPATADDLAIFARAAADPDGDLLTAMNADVGSGYQINDQVGYQQIVPMLAKHAADVFAIYGDQDKMFSAQHLAAITQALPAGHFATLSGAAHFSFVDRVDDFVALAAKDLAQLK